MLKRIQLQLAEYKRSIYKDPDCWIICTFTFPMLVLEWQLEKFINVFNKWMLQIECNKLFFWAVRLHWFDMNQPLRIAFPEYSMPIVIIVVQVYHHEMDIFKTNPSYLKINI